MSSVCLEIEGPLVQALCVEGREVAAELLGQLGSGVLSPIAVRSRTIAAISSSSRRRSSSHASMSVNGMGT